MLHHCLENLGGVKIPVWRCSCDILPSRNSKSASRSFAKTGFPGSPNMCDGSRNSSPFLPLPCHHTTRVPENSQNNWKWFPMTLRSVKNTSKKFDSLLGNSINKLSLIEPHEPSMKIRLPMENLSVSMAQQLRFRVYTPKKGYMYPWITYISEFLIFHLTIFDMGGVGPDVGNPTPTPQASKSRLLVCRTLSVLII